MLRSLCPDARCYLTQNAYSRHVPRDGKEARLLNYLASEIYNDLIKLADIIPIGLRDGVIPLRVQRSRVAYDYCTMLLAVRNGRHGMCAVVFSCRDGSSGKISCRSSVMHRCMLL